MGLRRSAPPSGGRPSPRDRRWESLREWVTDYAPTIGFVPSLIAISEYLEEHPLVQLYFAPWHIVSQNDIGESDLWRELMTVNDDQAAPQLLIEVLQRPSEKHDDFPKSVPECWIVDPAQNLVQVYRHDTERYERVVELSANDTMTSPLFPTLEIELDHIFAD